MLVADLAVAVIDLLLPAGHVYDLGEWQRGQGGTQQRCTVNDTPTAGAHSASGRVRHHTARPAALGEGGVRAALVRGSSGSLWTKQMEKTFWEN